MSRPTLVVMPNWVGDVVMALPTVAALAGGGRRLLALAKPSLEPLIALTPAISGSVTRRSRDADTVAAIRAAGCAEAVALPNSFRSAWLPFRARVERRWGYRGGFRAPLLTDPVGRPRGRRHQVRDYARLLEAMGIELGDDAVPRIELDQAGRARGRELLDRAGVAPTGGPLIGLFPGAEFGPSKRWPAARFAELARQLRRQVEGVRLVVIAGPKEVWLAVKIHEATARAAPVLGPDLDLADLARVLVHLDRLVTNDSGPMHLAAALGVRTTALFGPTDPRRTSPAGHGHQVLTTDRWCSPCFRRRCPLLHQRCLRDIDVDTVLAATRGDG